MPKAEDVFHQPATHASQLAYYADRHRVFGWWALLAFLSLGLLLEALHGFKIGWYLEVSSEIRRLMWTLAHAHGTLLSLVNLAFSVTACQVAPGASDPGASDPGDDGWRRWASACLIGATVLLPGGFFLGGTLIYAGDPGLGILLVPVGGVLLLVAVLLTARGVSSAVKARPT